jgi:AraC family transcriptional regulator
MIRTVFGLQPDRFHRDNVVLSARARVHRVRALPGPFSVKTVRRGEAQWQVGGQRFRVDRSSCLVVDNGEVYDLDIDAAEPVETFVVFFADALCDQVASARALPIEHLLEDPVPIRQRLPITQRLWDAASPLGLAMRRMARLDPLAEGAADLQLRIILDACADLAVQVCSERARIAASKAATRAELHRRCLRGLAFLDDRLRAPFDLERAARHACLSPHHFHRSFAAAFGEAPYRYVIRRRIALAQRLLLERDDDVTEVCAAVGYESLPSFTARFRRSTGFGPAAWRAKVRKEGEAAAPPPA